MTERIVVPYVHHERDLQTIYLAVTTQSQPTATDWKPALRDVIDGQRVVWARFPAVRGTVWLRDRDGERQVRPTTGARAETVGARQLARPVTAPATPSRRRSASPSRGRSTGIQYPSVRWEATLREPKGSFPYGARTFVVDVIGNVDLADVPIQLRIEPRDGTRTGWYPATWVSTEGNYGTCTAQVTNPPKGRGTVVVRPKAAGQQPTLECQNGRIFVQ